MFSSRLYKKENQKIPLELNRIGIILDVVYQALITKRL